jgi:hypothetical protein
VASYAVSLETPPPSEREYVTLTWAPLERLSRIRRKKYHDRDERTPGGAFLLPDEPCFVEVFPADRKVPALREAVSLTELDGGEGPSPVRRVQVLRYRAHRSAVLRYETDGGTAIGKVYRRASLAAEVRGKLQSLGPQAMERGLVIPRPLGRVRPDELVLMELLTGDDLAGRLKTGTGVTNGAEGLVRTAARAIGAFQSMRLESGTRRTLAGDLDGLASRAGRLTPGGDALLEGLGTLIERLRGRIVELPSRPLELVHGDFKPDQLLLQEDRVGIVDLDRACLGDGAIDVGNFAAILEEQALRFDRAELRALAEVFLDEVDRERCDPDLGLAARLYLVIALARKGVRALEGDLARGVAVSEEQRPGRRLLRRAQERLAAWEVR